MNRELYRSRLELLGCVISLSLKWAPANPQAERDQSFSALQPKRAIYNIGDSDAQAVLAAWCSSLLAADSNFFSSRGPFHFDNIVLNAYLIFVSGAGSYNRKDSADLCAPRLNSQSEILSRNRGNDRSTHGFDGSRRFCKSHSDTIA